MATVKIEAGALGARIRADGRGLPDVLKKAMFAGATRGRSWIVGQSPVDRGILRNAWKVIKILNGAELVNDQPYAGVVERGARPFKISKAGLEALKGWVIRKILKVKISVDAEKEAERIAWAIAKKFEKYGMKGQRFVWRNLPVLARLMDEEFNRYMTDFFNRPNRGKGK